MASEQYISRDAYAIHKLKSMQLQDQNVYIKQKKNKKNA